MHGTHVHEAVLAAGERETGVTAHLGGEGYDSGPIGAQWRVPGLDRDTAETLAKRVLAREHSFLVDTLEGIIAGEIALP